MQRVLKETGAIFLHCDPTASHYLKLILDVIFKRDHFRNEIVWKRKQEKHNLAIHQMGSVHDTIFWYGKSSRHKYNIQYLPYSDEYLKKTYKFEDERGRYATFPCTNDAGGNQPYEFRGITRSWRFKPSRMKQMYQEGMLVQARPNSPFRYKKYLSKSKGVKIQDLWDDIEAVRGKESLGYPTQKPIALMERIIKASSSLGDTVLDPFCGCGTTAHAAEKLGRKWVGIDIAPFSVELVRERIVGNFQHLNKDDIKIIGTPETIEAARTLAAQDKFEFEKWVCGAIGANGMYQNKTPGDKGADGGVDGVMEIDVVRKGKVHHKYAIVQVKGGNVTPDSVKALSETVRRLEAVAGILVCFKDQMGTVENQRSRATWSDDYETYPVIQGYSIEALLDDRPLKLPRRYGNRRGGRISALGLV